MQSQGEHAAGAAEAAAKVAEFTRQLQAQMPQPPVVISRGPDGAVRIGQSGSPAAVYEAARQQRNELRNQLERLEEQREDLSDQLNRPGPREISAVDQKGIEQRIATIDARIADVETQLAAADLNVARTAAIPGAVQPPPPRPREPGPPEEFWVITGIFMFVVIFPLTIAYARRIWRRGAAAVASIPQEIYDRFNRLDQAVDSVAIEVERIGEGQRFMTRIYADQQRGVGAGPAERIESAERIGEHQARK